MVKEILTIIGAIVTLLRWWLTPRKTKERAFKDNEDDRDEFTSLLESAALAKLAKSEKFKYLRSDYLSNARAMWLRQVRKNRQVRRGE